MTKISHVKYEVPKGEHDDYVVNLALAIYASVKKPLSRAKIVLFWK